MNTKKQLIAGFLVCLLSGCSCERKLNKAEEDAEEVVQDIKNDTIAIVDPAMNEDEVTKEAPSAKTKHKKEPVKKVAPSKKPKPNKPDVSPYDYQAQGIDINFLDDGELYGYGDDKEGMKYQILSEGPGSDNPKRGQTVVTHYNCWHDNKGKPGKLVDSTYDRDEPFEFKIGYGYVIRGFDEGLMDMSVGDKRRLHIPSEMAFGQMGAREAVPGDTPLIYEVELIDIK